MTWLEYDTHSRKKIECGGKGWRRVETSFIWEKEFDRISLRPQNNAIIMLCLKHVFSTTIWILIIMTMNRSQPLIIPFCLCAAIGSTWYINLLHTQSCTDLDTFPLTHSNWEAVPWNKFPRCCCLRVGAHWFVLAGWRAKTFNRLARWLLRYPERKRSFFV